MQNIRENGRASAADVIPAVAQYLGRYDKEDFTQAPVVVQEMSNDLMETPYGDEVSYRSRALHVLHMIQDFGDTIEPYTQEVINEAVTSYGNE